MSQKIQKTVSVVCDGCGKDLEYQTAGSAELRVEVFGEIAPDGTKPEDYVNFAHLRKIDLCGECVPNLPVGAVRKKGKASEKNGETPAAETTPAPEPEPEPEKPKK